MSDPYQDALDAMAYQQAAQQMQAQQMNAINQNAQLGMHQQMGTANFPPVGAQWASQYPNVHERSAAYKAGIQKADPEKWETIAALMALTEAELEIRDSPFEKRYMQEGTSLVYQLECYAWGSVIQWLSDETGGDIEQWRQIFGKLADVNQAKAAAGHTRRVKPAPSPLFSPGIWANQMINQYQNQLAMQQYMKPTAQNMQAQGVANAAIQSGYQAKTSRPGP